MKTLIFLLLIPPTLFADTGQSALIAINNPGSTSSYAVGIQILLLMTAFSFIPGILMAMTSFTRIIIVLSILRQALGLAQTPTNQILIGISLFMTYFIMAPVFKKINDTSIQPYIQSRITQQEAIDIAQKPIKKFMVNQTRSNDIALYTNLAKVKENKDKNSVSMSILLPAFITSEMKTAFQIGFIIFLPFLIIDLIVASVLMSMGMMMLSPLVISLPFKIMLFVLIDGWNLILGSIASSFAL